MQIISETTEYALLSMEEFESADLPCSSNVWAVFEEYTYEADEGLEIKEEEGHKYLFGSSYANGILNAYKDGRQSVSYHWTEIPCGPLLHIKIELTDENRPLIESLTNV